MSFTINRLVNNRALIAGTDITGTVGQLVVDTTQWDEINSHKKFDQAAAEFDATVDAFYAPILAAAAKAEAATKKPELDQMSFVVLHEEVEPVAGQAGQLIKLTHDSQLLRFIEHGKTGRLLWVKAGDFTTLEILAEEQGTVTVHDVAGTPADDVNEENIFGSES